MTAEEITSQKNIIIGQIKKFVPYFKNFFEIQGTVREFSDSLYDFELNPIHRQRQELVKNKLFEKIEELFGRESRQQLNINFPEKPAFNIVDHHQVLGHPFLLSSNIVSSAKKILSRTKPEAIIVVSSGDVPPNNYFSKSGFLLHGKKVPFFSVSERELTSYYLPKRKFNFVERLNISNRWNEFNSEEQKFLIQHQNFIDSLDFTNCRNYADQITLIVKNTWPFLFENDLRQNLPELIYITQEELVTKCLITLLREDNFISRAIFDASFRETVLDNFRGIVVTWNEAEKKGTHFFWRKYPQEPRSLRMYVQEDYLVPEDKRFIDLKLHLDRDTIIELLQKKEIYPSLFLIFSVLNFYAGIRPLTGFGSTVYLELFKEAWIKCLQRSDFSQEIKLMETVKTTGLVAGLVLFYKKYNGKQKALYAHDILCDAPITKNYLKSVLEMKFTEVLTVGVADMYDYFSQKYIPTSEKIKKTINFDDLASLIFK